MIWKLLASIASRTEVTWWLIQRAQRTPYTPIMSRDGCDLYMQRWWLFNPYGKDEQGEPTPARFAWLPSIRIHHIIRPDIDRHLHDHPWNARTIVLSGWYAEERPFDPDSSEPDTFQFVSAGEIRERFLRTRGYTGRLLFGQYHRISNVSPGGVYTLFITWRKRGTWGFQVDGKKVPWREYLDMKDAP